MEPEIRRLVIDDYDSLIELWRETGLPLKVQGRDARSEMNRQFKTSNVAAFGLFDGDLLVGSVLATHDERKGWINRLAVKPARRDRGNARRLLGAAEDWLTSCGIGIFACIIEGGNDSSKKLFEAADYLLFEEASYYTKRSHPDI